MIRFECDWCGLLKNSDETWISGLAAEAVGVTAARREVTILPVWKRDNAVHPLAVHFCSVECKDDYMERLFDETPDAESDLVVDTTRRVGTRTPKTSSSRAHSRTKKSKKAA